jgi:nitroreductase
MRSASSRDAAVTAGVAKHMSAPLRTDSSPPDKGACVELPPPVTRGGMPLLQALSQRQSWRNFAPTPLEQQTLSDLLWAAAGVNRERGAGRTAPSAMKSNEVDLYVARRDGLFLYEPLPHRLRLCLPTDVRRSTGYEEFVDNAPLELIYVADLARMPRVAAQRREAYAAAAAGAMAQNVYLFCASAGLATALRAWIDPGILAAAMQLRAEQCIVLSQGVGLACDASA